MRYLLFIFSCITLIIPSLAYAEISAAIISDPVNPKPHEAVTLTLSSYSFDVDSAFITWYLKDKQVREGFGEKRLSLTTGGVGEVLPIRVQARLQNGSVVAIDTTIAPQGVTLMWESPESYVPPFYEGRSLPGEGATVHVVAQPLMSKNGVSIPAGDLAYAWFVNNQFMDDSSGRGKYSAFLPLDYLSESSVIKVVVRDAEGTTATEEVTIKPVVPLPLFYLSDPALGIDYTRNAGLRLEATKEFTLELVPYYFSKNGSLRNTASYTWSLDGLPITPKTETSITLQPKENSYGSRVLSVALTNTKRILQKADRSIALVFDTR